MKILQLTNYFYPHIGGIEQVTRDIIKALPEHEHRVLCFNHEKGTTTDEIDGVKITRVHCQAKVFSQSLAFGYGRVLKQTLREFAPDLVIFHHPNPFVAHFWQRYLRKREFKTVVLYHLDITKQKVLRWFFKHQTLKLLRAADRIVVTSPNYIEGSKFLTKFSAKCFVCPCCVDFERFAPNAVVEQLVCEIKAENAGKTLCFAVGRHIKYKGMIHLVRASRFLSDDCRIVIGGAGPLTNQLKKAAMGDNKIVFAGRLSNDQLTAYYQACDVFCFPSITKNEAFGLALAEAMSFGKPAVTFIIPGSGVNYVNLHQVTGLTVANGDAAALAAAVDTLAHDTALREQYGEQAKARVLANFTLSQFREHWLALLDELNGEKQV